MNDLATIQESLAEILNALPESSKKTHIVDDSPVITHENGGKVLEFRKKS